jgi:tetratricopeptide (TPR) repeat protein
MNREAILKKAEQLLRDGKLGAAIDEYVRLIDQHPRDWGAVNALGDLYVRAGRPEMAIAQFTRVADFLFEEGFLPRAQALYKKTLKVDSGNEHTLRQLAEIATRQGLLADARHYLRQLGEPAVPEAPAADVNGGLPAPEQAPAAETESASIAAAPEPVVQPAAAPELTAPSRDDPPPADAGVDTSGASEVLLEIDLSDALGDLVAPGNTRAPQESLAEPLRQHDAELEPLREPVRPQSLESVFEGMRRSATFEQPDMNAAAQYDVAMLHLRESRLDEAAAALQAAARAPALRFKSASELGRLLLRTGSIQQGIDWLERAVEAPAPDAQAKATLMYDLADALEQIDESARALAILLEIDADAPHFRDVPARVVRLKRVLAGS